MLGSYSKNYGFNAMNVWEPKVQSRPLHNLNFSQWISIDFNFEKSLKIERSKEPTSKMDESSKLTPIFEGKRNWEDIQNGTYY